MARVHGPDDSGSAGALMEDTVQPPPNPTTRHDSRRDFPRAEGRSDSRNDNGMGEAPRPENRAETIHRIAPRIEAGGAPAPTAHVTDEQMRMILDVSRLLAVPTDIDPLLCRIAEFCCDLLSCERASIFLHEPASDELWTKVALGRAWGSC